MLKQFLLLCTVLILVSSHASALEIEPESSKTDNSTAVTTATDGVNNEVELLRSRSSTFDQSFFAQSCCKICRAGKACGDSCISRLKTCTKPPGCACDE